VYNKLLKFECAEHECKVALCLCNDTENRFGGKIIFSEIKQYGRTGYGRRLTELISTGRGKENKDEEAATAAAEPAMRENNEEYSSSMIEMDCLVTPEVDAAKSIYDDFFAIITAEHRQYWQRISCRWCCRYYP